MENKPSLLLPSSTSIRKLPVNLKQADIKLFEQEIRKDIPETTLNYIYNVKISPEGILSKSNIVLSESFVSLEQYKQWAKRSIKARLKYFIKNELFKNCQPINQDVFWITDDWSHAYFHWFTDALPRLLAIHHIVNNSTLLLPKKYRYYDYINTSLLPFRIQDIRYIDNPIICKNLKTPTHTAPTGNYNEVLIKRLRELYTSFYSELIDREDHTKIYISRSKAQKRKIINEQEVIEIVKKYGFKVICFEEYSFEDQIKMALRAKFMISNHGGGLTNLLFMSSGGAVLELRKYGDSNNNCFFTLASALDINYFYQLCETDQNDINNTSDLKIDCQLLSSNIIDMLNFAGN